MESKYSFSYCQKIIILSPDRQSVLLARRQGEQDYDGVYSFIGGRMETGDKSILAAIIREKNEEIGKDVRLKILPNESYNVLFEKHDGSKMVLPHLAGIVVSGTITLSDEYSDYKWVLVHDLDSFEPKIANIPQLARWAVNKLADVRDDQLVEI